MYTYDYILVGSGLAGLYAAYLASKYGSVALLTKSNIRESNSYFAQGGIAAVTAEGDEPLFHFQDTITAGRGLCDYPAVEVLVNEGPERIHELIQDGMRFDTENGEIALGLEGGHHHKRILHAGGDATGKMVTDFMISEVEKCPTITVFDNHAVVDLLCDEQGCYGVRAWDFNKNKEEIFTAHNVFLTAGGTAAIYKRTTNPHTTIGDGLALAYRGGCLIEDMEFIQFHPTAMYTSTGEAYLVSEAVRGEGARLYNQQGERFMLGKHELAELAPRDVVAQCIYQQMQEHHQEYVYLSLKHLPPEMIKKRFPNIFEKCKELGIDMTDKIPVAPAAHYTVGGVKTDLSGRTNIPHLYVCGELASSGIMGANRLASCYQLNPANEEAYVALKEQVADIMMRHAGIIRTEEGLQEGLKKLDALKNLKLTEEHEYYSQAADNLLTVARLIMRSALFRKESRGGHFRADYPEADDSYLCHVIQQKGKELRTIPVENHGKYEMDINN